MKHLAAILISCFFPSIIQAQADRILRIPADVISYEYEYSNTDSLLRVLQHQSGKQKVLTLCYTAQSMFLNKNDKAPEYIDWAMQLSDSLNYNSGKVMALIVLAAKTFQKNDYKGRNKIFRIAENFLDRNTHWRLKYHVWYQLGQNYKDLFMSDSATYYFLKPLEELDCDTAWIACLGSYYWLANIARLKGNHEAEILNLLTAFNIVMNHGQYRHFTTPNFFIGHFESVVAYYTRQGYFKESVVTCKTVLDSLRRWDFKPAVQPYVYAKFLGQLGRAYHHWGRLDSAIIYHDSATYYFNKTLDEFPEIRNNHYEYPLFGDWQINVANQMEEKAGVLIKLGELEIAEKDLLQSVSLRMVNKDLLGVGMSLDKLGELRALQGNFAEAVEYYDSSLRYKEKFSVKFNQINEITGNSYWNNVADESISFTFLKLGDLYRDWGNYKIAELNYNKSLKESRRIKYLKGEAEVLNALGVNFLDQHFTDSAFACFNQALLAYRKMENTFGEAETNINLAKYYLLSNNLVTANRYLSDAVLNFRKLEMPARLAEIYLKQAEVFSKQQRLEDAREKYDSALLLADTLGLKKTLLACHQGLSEIWEQLGNIEKAYFHYKISAELKDELFTIENIKILAEVEGRYEHEKNVTRIELLNKENELHQKQASNRKLLLLSVSGFTIVSFLLLMLLIRQNKLKAEHEKNCLHQKLLRSQLNPHFIFNALATVQNSIISEQPALANHYLTRFSKLMRNILISSAQETVNLDQELTTLENYLALQKIRYPEKFDFAIEVDENLDIDNLELPAMLIQPFVENAIEHGFRHKETKGLLKIRFLSKSGMLMIEVEDNGIGRKKASEIYQRDPKDYKSMATEIIRQRIKSLNKNQKRKINFSIVDLNDEDGNPSGTRVVFELAV